MQYRWLCESENLLWIELVGGVAHIAGHADMPLLGNDFLQLLSI
jgi:hypothetical protein